MNISQYIRNDIYWVGASDRRLALFENMFPLPNGVAYNSISDHGREGGAGRFGGQLHLAGVL